MKTSDVGRNDPCPCGSGKKFKRCCLAKAQAEPTSPRQLVQQVHDKLLMDLLRLAKATYDATGITKAWDEFWPEAPSEDFRDHQPYQLLFLPWLFYFYFDVPEGVDDSAEYPSEHTLAAQYLRKRRHGLDDVTISYLEAARREPLAFWQVESVEHGRGLHLRDFATGRTVFAVDVAASESLNRFDIAFAQVIEVAGIYTVNAMAPYALQPARFRERILEHVTHYAQARSKEPMAWFDLDIDFISLYHEFVEEMFNPPKPMLANTSGEPMLLTTTRYTFEPDQRPAVLQHLRAIPDIELNDETTECSEFRWTGTATGTQMMGKVTKATIKVSEAGITVSANSMARDREFRGVLERDLGELLRRESTRHETVDLESRGEGRERAEPLDVSALPAEAQEQLRAHIHQLYMKWADEKVPALGGLTPREAVKTPEGRERVIGLVNDWENTMNRGPKPQIEFDFEKLRRELGVLEK